MSSITVSRLRSQTWHHWWFGGAFYLMAVLSGMGGGGWLGLGLIGVTLAWWAIHDSVVRGHPIPFFSRNWFVLMPGILVPTYLIWSRGWWGLALLVAHTLAWCFLALFVAIIALMRRAIMG